MVDEQLNQLIVRCREFLNGQKLTNKAGSEGKEILFKFEEISLYLNPMHNSGHPVLVRKLFVNCTQQKEIAELWASAISRYALDMNYDEWFVSSLAATPNITGQAPTQLFLFYNFESESELCGMLSQPDTFKGLCESLRVFGNYVMEVDRKP